MQPAAPPLFSFQDKSRDKNRGNGSRRYRTDGSTNHGPLCPHFSGAFEEVALQSALFFEKGKKGYRDGVWLVPVPVEGYFSALVILEEGAELVGEYKARREGETPRKQVFAKGGQKVAAAHVEIVLYRGDVLAEDGDNVGEPTEDSWEIISINAGPGPMPIHPMTLIANHFKLDGGTGTGMSPEEFEAALRISVLFWKDKELCSGS